MSNANKYREMFDYLSAPQMPREQAGLLVFGRKDLLIARKVVDLSRIKFASFVVFSGGIGKDSGNLKVPEAEYLATGARRIACNGFTPIKLPPFYTETKSTNGGENVRNSVALMQAEHLPYENALTTVAHATSLRRLTETVKHETVQRDTPIATLYSVPSDYRFNPNNPSDQQEAVAEMLRIADWPAKGWLQPQIDMPDNLVDFARNQAASLQ